MVRRDLAISLFVTLLLVFVGFVSLISAPGELYPFNIAGSVNASFAGGSGTVGNPYQISNVTQLQNMSSDLTAHYILINDIDASATIGWNGGEGFDPIGDDIIGFSGSFDGQNYNISTLSISRPNEDYIGLFGYLSPDSILINISLIQNNISGDNYVGGLVGESFFGIISNCSASGNVSCKFRYMGGLVGYNYYGTVIYCSTSGNVGDNLSWSFYGGLVGYNDHGNISFCYATGFVGGNDNVGGLVGYNDMRSTISNCYATGTVTHGWGLGGLIGVNAGTVYNCYATGNVNPGGNSGLMTDYGGTVSNSFWDMQTSGQSTSGGGIGKTTSQMKTKSTFTSAGWNFSSVWDIIGGESYPFLRSFVYGGIPVIITNDIHVAYEDIQYLVDYNAISSLPGGMGAFWKLETNASDWLSIQDDGVLSGIPSNDDVGTYWVNVSVSLNDEGSDFSNFKLIVYNTNDDPMVATLSIPDAIEDELYEFTLIGYDIDSTMDDLTWSIKTDADFLDVAPSTGILTGLPTNDDVGTYWLMVNLSDGIGGFGEVNLSLTVQNVNDDPEIQPFEIIDFHEDGLLFMDLDAVDIDPTDDILEWSFSSNVSFIHIDPTAGTLTGRPKNDHVGTWWVNVTVFDGNGGSDRVNFTLTVLNVNDEPVITSSYLPDAIEDEFYSTIIQAFDIDPAADILEFRILRTNASFLNIDSITGNLSGLPTNDDVGTYWVEVIVSDGNGGAVWRNFTLTVLNVNDGPSLIVDELTLTVEEDSEGTSFELYEIFQDIDGDPLSFDHEGADHLAISVKDGIATIIPDGNWCGEEIIHFTASDGALSVGMNVTVIVTPVNDAPLGASITAESSYYEGRDQNVNATAYDVDLQYGDELTFRWASNISGEIGIGRSINLSLSVGHHKITVTVTDIIGFSTTDSVEIEVLPLDKEERNGSDDDKLDTGKLIGFFIIGFLIGLVFIFILLRRKKGFGSLTEAEADEILDEMLEDILEE